MSHDTPRRRRALYVEDAFDQAALVKAFFGALPDFDVTHVQDGDQALQLIEREPWDVLVTDLNLPGTDGFTLIRRMRAVSSATPIVVTTGYTQAEYEEQALRAGADQVMIKPLSQELFLSRVTALLEGAEGPLYDAAEVVLAIEGRLGDAEMGCGGALMRAVHEGRSAVLVPLLEREAAPEELRAAALAAGTLGIDLRIDRTLFGNAAAQLDMVERTVDELRPTTVYLPADDDHDSSRRHAAEIGRAAAVEVETLLGYETATTGRGFVPTHFVDVRKQMLKKMEALTSYQSLGAPRPDLRPRMAQAYARYWGRLRDFGEVEAFERVRDPR